MFISRLESENVRGFFHYSLSGDLFDENVRWGLGNTVFATKIYYTLGMLEELPSEKKDELANFIESFQKNDGTISDPLIIRGGFATNFLGSLKNNEWGNILSRQVKIAETRQALSALKLLGRRPRISYLNFPQSEAAIEKYLQNLNWERPWSAGSHFSHLLFFLANSDLKQKDRLIDHAVDWVNRIQNPDTGSWHAGDPDVQQKINGAMKIITGLKAAGRTKFDRPEKLIDLCLEAKNDSHACDNFNIVYVLNYANKLTNSLYRYDEIVNFCYNRLDIYKKYYFPEIGGFSFMPGKANDIYYGAEITKGLNEPDIHGTVMFLWGISIIAQLIGAGKELGFKEFIS